MPSLNVLTNTKTDNRDGTGKVIVVVTNRCMVCKSFGTVEVPEAEWNNYQQNPELFIQDTLRSLSAGDREQIITGTHDACWDIMFPPEED